MHDIKMRIKSVKDTRQITKAMKLISAAKLKKARQQLEMTRPYFLKVKDTMADILSHSGSVDNPYFHLRHEKAGRKIGYVVLTGDKGLAGGYNHNIIKLAEDTIKSESDVFLYVAGDVGRNYFIKKNFNVMGEFDYPVQNPTVYRARDIAEQIIELFSNGTLDEIHIIYTKMVNSINYKPVAMKLLPLELEALRNDIGLSNKVKGNIDDNLTYTPSPKAVLDILIHKYIKGILYGAFVEAFASEQSARMAAMDNATSNADKMLSKLNLFYNRARQAAITQEISEVVSGAAALK